jgi:acyl-CoA dehydrogenase
MGHVVAQLVQESPAVLDRLTRYLYLSNDADDITGRIEVAYKMMLALEPLQKKIDLAVKAGEIRRAYGFDWIQQASDKAIVSSTEAAELRELDALVERAINVDHFDPKDIVKS